MSGSKHLMACVIDIVTSSIGYVRYVAEVFLFGLVSAMVDALLDKDVRRV
jgi:hypothetical protein